MVRLIGFSLAIMISAVIRLAAQQPDTLPIDTDRPDFTDGVHTLPRGYFQLETGYTVQQGRGTDATESQSFPEMLIRIGVASRAELRIGQNYLVEGSNGPGAQSSRGFDDLYVGTKVGPVEERGIRPAISFELQLRIPSGSTAVSGNVDRRLLPGGAILLGWETSGPWSAGVEFFGTRTADTHGQGVASLSVQYQVAARAQLYAECFTMQPINAGPGAEDYVNSGILVVLSRVTQIDARVGLGLNQAADRYFVGLGFAVRH